MMRRWIPLALAVIAASVGVPAAAQESAPEKLDAYVETSNALTAYDDSDPRALSDFKDELDPHGRWVDHPTWGTVWVPSVVVVGGDFAPYRTAGHWAVTDGGD